MQPRCLFVRVAGYPPHPSAHPSTHPSLPCWRPRPLPANTPVWGGALGLTLESPPPVPHSPLSYHHLFFNLSNRPCSLSFNTARFTGFLHGGDGVGWVGYRTDGIDIQPSGWEEGNTGQMGYIYSRQGGGRGHTQQVSNV